MWMKHGGLFALFGAAMLCLGCAKSQVPVYPVQGTVTLNGITMATGTVTFVPVEPGPAISGEIMADGTYRLKTHDNRMGAPKGQYQVSVSAVRLSPAGIAMTLLPTKYSTPQSSGLSTAVKSTDKNVYDIALTGKPIRPDMLANEGSRVE